MRVDDTGRGPGRRAFVVGMAATFATRVAAAQPQRGPLPHRIGWISTETEPDPFIDGFREGLRRHGYVEGQNLVLELRYTRDLDVLRKAVAEREYADAGGLMSYGAQQRDAYVRLAAYADKLLRGAKAAELPIEQPTTFELIINLRTARALGLTIPQSLLQRADRLLE
jgi:ABC transporter substrate binding protein